MQQTLLVFWKSLSQMLGAFAYSRKDFRHVRPSVCPHATARLPLEGTSARNLILGTSMKIWRGIPSLVKIGQERRELYMKTSLRLTVAGDKKKALLDNNA